MRLIKVGLASVNPTVGSVFSNVDRCVQVAHDMAGQHVTVAAFPEQVIGGYAPEDLIQWRGFVDAQWQQLRRFAQETQGHGTVFALGVAVAQRGHLYNAAAVVHRGDILGVVPKEKLTTYNVLYEARTFSPGVPGRPLARLDKHPRRSPVRRTRRHGGRRRSSPSGEYLDLHR